MSRTSYKIEIVNPAAVFRHQQGWSQSDEGIIAGIDVTIISAIEGFKVGVLPRKFLALVESVSGPEAAQRMAEDYQAARHQRGAALLAATRRQSQPADAEATASII